MARKYYTLLARDGKTAPWSIQFGDYDRETVATERDDWAQSGTYLKRDMMIVETGPKQADFLAKVDHLNTVKVLIVGVAA